MNRRGRGWRGRLSCQVQRGGDGGLDEDPNAREGEGTPEAQDSG